MNVPRLTLLILVACCIDFVGCASTHQFNSNSQPLASGLPISISPSSALPGSPALTVTITGSNFIQGPIFSQAVWSINGIDTFLSTTFVDSAHVTAIVPASLLTSPLVADVYVRKWDHIENSVLSRSQAAKFAVTGSALPFISSISPATVSAGSPDLQLTITGANLVPTVGHEYTAIGWYEAGKSEVLLSATSVATDEVVAIIPAPLLGSTINSSIVIEFRDYRDFLDDPPHAKSNSASFTVN